MKKLYHYEPGDIVCPYELPAYVEETIWRVVQFGGRTDYVLIARNQYLCEPGHMEGSTFVSRAVSLDEARYAFFAEELEPAFSWPIRLWHGFLKAVISGGAPQ